MLTFRVDYNYFDGTSIKRGIHCFDQEDTQAAVHFLKEYNGRHLSLQKRNVQFDIKSLQQIPPAVQNN